MSEDGTFMRHVFQKAIGLGLLALFFTVGCSRGAPSPGVRLSFPDWQAMRASDVERRSKVSTLAVDESQIEMLIVNVTGPGLSQPVFFQWENQDHKPGLAPPNAISLNVPRGDG